MTEKRLFLLDAFALIFRAYFAFIKNPRRSSSGMDTSAIFGFTLSLLELLETENPSHLAVVFDTSAPTQRHIDFPAYKANRDETPEAIRVAVPWIEKILLAFGIPIIKLDGYEADDLIGTLAKKAELAGYTTYMMTPDKDFGQLVSPKTLIYKPGRGGNPAEVMGEKEVCEKFGIKRVQQVIDMLGMMGDAVDNIPGLPGVGEKTAQKLLETYDSLENVIAHAHEIKGKMGEKIQANAELGLLSKRLATIVVDAPIELMEDELIMSELDADALKQLFEELEFRSLLKRTLEKHAPTGESGKGAATQAAASGMAFQASLFGEAEAETPTDSRALSTLETYEHFYQLVENDHEIEILLEHMLKQSAVCWDTETDGLNEFEAQLVGLAISWQGSKAFYVPFPPDFEGQKRRIERFKPFFEHGGIEKIGQNLKFDMAVLQKYGIEVAAPLFDTMLAHYLINPDARHNFDVLCENWLQHQTVHIDALIGAKGKNQGNMRQVPLERIKEYAGEDADFTYQLAAKFKPELNRNELMPVFESLEMPLVPVLMRMEAAGIRINREKLGGLSAQMGQEINSLNADIQELAGLSFNVASPKQLGEVLFDHLRIGNKPKKTKTGQYATSEDILQELVKAHPIVEKILEYRQLQKLKSTYVDALPAIANPLTDRIHTSFNQAVAATGRLSSNNPNLQNIPIRHPRGQEIRAAFIPAEGDFCLLSADYSQIELRLIAEMSGDEAMVEAFLQGQDIHAATAAKLFGIPIDDVNKTQRSHAKTVNFGIIYGVSAFGLSQQTSLSRSEAAELIQNYFKTYPGIKAFMDAQIAKARELGYVQTMFGRRRILRDIHSKNQTVRGHAERNAINAPIQGSAADIIKKAMIAIDAEMMRQNMQSKMLLQVHDELVFDCYLPEKENLQNLVKGHMEGAVKTKVPLLAETGFGTNWLEAH